MSVDYIRVYQPKGAHNIGCDPPDFPTAAYINTYAISYKIWKFNCIEWAAYSYLGAYTDANLTDWKSFNQTVPKNRLNGGC